MKNKYSKILVLLTVIVLVLSFVSAEILNKEDNKAKLGNNKANEPLDKITFIHYKDGTVKEIGVNRAIVSGGKCYKLLGVKWSSLPVSYVINPSGYDEIFVASNISAAIQTWDDATSKTLFSTYSIDPFVIWGIADGKSAYVFGDYPNDNVIAVTNIWYMRYRMQIVDYDVLFNTRFSWGDAANPLTPSVMDLQNIATHETGHGVGLADIYTTSCSAVTMYGYSTYGETSKRTLEQPDITGLQKMYGI